MEIGIRSVKLIQIIYFYLVSGFNHKLFNNLNEWFFFCENVSLRQCKT